MWIYVYVFVLQNRIIKHILTAAEMYFAQKYNIPQINEIVFLFVCLVFFCLLVSRPCVFQLWRLVVSQPSFRRRTSTRLLSLDAIDSNHSTKEAFKWFDIVSYYRFADVVKCKSLFAFVCLNLLGAKYFWGVSICATPLEFFYP